MRCSPAPCENVMLSCASVDQRLTGTDSSMKLRRRSESVPRWWTSGPGFRGRERSPPARRVRSLPTDLRGRNTAEGEVNLAPIFSPLHPRRNDLSRGARQNPPIDDYLELPR